MRTLKAKAWDKKRQCWNYAVLEFDADGELELGDNFELCIWTGLKDKNGVEIYEGDILALPEGCNGDHRAKAGRFPVEFDEAEFWVNTNGSWQESSLASHTLNRRCEVIGNIYENPDLLEQAS